MKQLCVNCGRRYDAELTGGVCPHCGRGIGQEPQAEGQKSRQEVLQQMQNKAQVLQQAGESHRNEVKEKLAWFMCCALVIVLVISLIAGRLMEKNALQENKASQKIDAAQTYTYTGDTMEVGSFNRTVQVTQAQLLTDMKELDKGCRMARIHCRIPKQDEWDDISFDALLQVDGVYYNSTYIAKIKEHYPDLGKKLFDPYAIGCKDMDEGWLYFPVPEDAEKATFWICEKHRDEALDVKKIIMHGLELTLEKGELGL